MAGRVNSFLTLLTPRENQESLIHQIIHQIIRLLLTVFRTGLNLAENCPDYLEALLAEPLYILIGSFCMIFVYASVQDEFPFNVKSSNLYQHAAFLIPSHLNFNSSAAPYFHAVVDARMRSHFTVISI